jgi:hypothetical protein
MCQVLDLDTLIRIKRAASRPRDFTELEFLRARARR